MTWFLTLSATDMNWDDLMSVLCKQKGLPFSKDHISALSRKEKSKLMIANPVTTAWFTAFAFSLVD